MKQPVINARVMSSADNTYAISDMENTSSMTCNCKVEMFKVYIMKNFITEGIIDKEIPEILDSISYSIYADILDYQENMEASKIAFEVLVNSIVARANMMRIYAITKPKTTIICSNAKSMFL